MKHFKKLILFLIILSFSYEEEQQYIPIDKYGKEKKNNFIESNIMFALDIREIKESIYLTYSSSVKINLNLIQYYWSKENYKNIHNLIVDSNIKSSCEGISRSEILGKVTYSIYCIVDKQNDSYNTLIIQVNRQNYYNDFEVSHTKYNTNKIMIIIFIIVFVLISLFIIIGIIYEKCYKRIYVQNYRFMDTNNNNENYTPYNNNQYNNFNSNSYTNSNQYFNYQGNTNH